MNNVRFKKEISVLLRYAFALIVSSVALFLQIKIDPLVQSVQFLMLYPAIFLIAWVAGFGPTVLALLLCIVAKYQFLPSAYTFEMSIFCTLALAIGGVISYGKARLKRSMQSGAELKYALDASAIVAVTDAHGKITYANDKFCEISKYPREELIGQDHRIINSGHHPKEFFRDLWQTIKSGKEWSGEIQNRAKDGSIYWVWTSIVPFLDDKGRPYQYIAIRNDITQRKNAEEALRIAISSRDEFLSIASHELKTPLTSLVLQTQLFKRGIENNDERFFEHDRIKKLIDQNDRQSARLTRLVDDMLDIGRINSGRLTIQKENISLNELFKEVVERLSPVMNETSTPVDYRCDEIIEGHCDRFRMEQVLINLLTNTMKYGEKKPVLVTLEKHENKAHLKVIDHGMGVPEDVKERIFNRFERAISYHEVTGLGLGLFITKEIVEAHGGMIWVESEGEKKGSTFHVEIPLTSIN